METASLPNTNSAAWAERFTVSLCAQGDSARKFLAAQRARLEQAETAIQEAIERLQEELQGYRNEAERLSAAHDVLADRLADADRRLAEKGEGKDGDEELQRRYELALDDIREARNANSELQQQLAKARSAPASSAHQSGQLDWEAEKKRIFAALDEDFDQDDKSQQAERLKIEDVVRKTDEVIAAKQHEIEELKARLEEASHASNAKAAKEVSAELALGHDSVIRVERERLKSLQEQCDSKLRKAEVELSVERARIARMRAELDEQLRAAKEAAPETPATSNSETPPAEQSVGGRWLARMGLTAADRQPGRHL